MPSYYLVESSYFTVSHGARESQGVLGDTKGTARIYLHVLPLTDAEAKSLRPRSDAHGNLDHTRFALRGSTSCGRPVCRGSELSHSAVPALGAVAGSGGGGVPQPPTARPTCQVGGGDTGTVK